MFVDRRLFDFVRLSSIVQETAAQMLDKVAKGTYDEEFDRLQESQAARVEFARVWCGPSAPGRNERQILLATCQVELCARS
jgi:hypothetical protein